MISNAERILICLDEKLKDGVELTLYGRAALQLGFDPPAPDFALSLDVDAVFWMGQAEMLQETTNFWSAVEAVNAELEQDGLYISHFFEEDQVILTPHWREQRAPIPGRWKRLELFRLGNADLFLSKLMRDDPQDQHDARFILERAGWTEEEVQEILRSARLPELAEIQEEFVKAKRRLLGS